MMNSIISFYIKRLNKNDINSFALNNGIFLNNQQLDYFYTLIKNNWQDIVSNPNEYLLSIREKVDSDTYNKIVNLYSIYYSKLYH